MLRNRDVAFVRKLCALGLPAQTLVHTLLPAVRELVPATSGAVFWVNASSEITSLYAERMLPPESMAAYYLHHYRAAREGFVTAFRQRALDADPVSFRSFTAAEQATRYFIDVMKPLDAYHVMYCILRHADAAFAQLSLYRGRGDAPFTEREAADLRDLRRHLERGLAHQHAAVPPPRGPSVVAEKRLGLVDEEGRIVAGSDAWLRAIRLAAMGAIAPMNAEGEGDRTSSFLRALCGPLRDAGRDEAHSERDTAWGTLSFGVYRLNVVGATHYAVLVERLEPEALSLVRGVRNAVLTPQQCEIALLLCRGDTNPEIAAAMNLTLNTVSSHVKEIFRKLGVSDRREIPEQLLRRAQATAVAY